MPDRAPMITDLQPGEEILRGVLDRIVYYNEENHFCIGQMKAEGRREPITLSGMLPGIQCGETLRLIGQWTHHPMHGPQFKLRTFESTLPATVHGITQYLGSGMVPGIGKTYAKKIVDCFGIETLNIIDHDSGRLREVPGIGKKRALEIKNAWDDQKSLREVLIFLRTYGITVGQCLRIVREYGVIAPQILKEDPYRVAREIDGIGFKTADRIAINLGLANDSAQRIEAGILHAMKELETEGHTAFPRDELCIKATELLEVDHTRVTECINKLISSKELRVGENPLLVQLPHLFQAEKDCAYHLRRLQSCNSGLPPIRIDAAIQWAQERSGFDFAPEQAQALQMALSEKISIITGGPGTGKTTILRALVSILLAKKVRLLLASPTGRAAQRMTESTGHYAATLHRMLEYSPAEHRFLADEKHPLSCDYLIIDETSMLDTRMAAALLRAIPHATHLLFVGDVYQLPSIGAGNVLSDIISSGHFAVTTLKQIFRQKGISNIVTTAHRILQGETSPPRIANTLSEISPQTDLHFIPCTSPEACLEIVQKLCTEYIPQRTRFDPVREVQILAPMHRGEAGIQNFNRQLQTSFAPEGKALQLGGLLLREGDKIIQLKNSYSKGLFNGDIGWITEIETGKQTLKAEFNREIIDFERMDLGDISLAYAISIHKSQGSEFPVVIIPLLKQHFMLLQRNLIYTAITRGRKKVFIVGDPSAFAMAVGNEKSQRRVTDLITRLRSETLQR
jgi:exodeoxyribonuclease V alpha subunit